MSTFLTSKRASILRLLPGTLFFAIICAAFYFIYQADQRNAAKALLAEQQMLARWQMNLHFCISNSGGREDVLNIQYKYNTEYGMLMSSIELENGRRVLEYQRKDMSPAWKCRIEWKAR